jgi:Domain of unknown function (DUF5658)
MMRFAGVPPAAAVLLCLLGTPAVAAAQGNALPTVREAAETAARQMAASTPQAPAEVGVHQRRPAALLPLYISLATLQALDVHSTARALADGAVEANPLMKGLAANEVGLLAIKAAGTTSVLLASEHMWKRNRTGAVIFMIAANSAMMWVVQHNYRAVH